MVHASLNALADGVLAWKSDQAHEPRRMTSSEAAGGGVAGGGTLGDVGETITTVGVAISCKNTALVEGQRSSELVIVNRSLRKGHAVLGAQFTYAAIQLMCA